MQRRTGFCLVLSLLAFIAGTGPVSAHGSTSVAGPTTMSVKFKVTAYAQLGSPAD